LKKTRLDQIQPFSAPNRLKTVEFLSTIAEIVSTIIAIVSTFAETVSTTVTIQSKTTAIVSTIVMIQVKTVEKVSKTIAIVDTIVTILSTNAAIVSTIATIQLRKLYKKRLLAAFVKAGALISNNLRYFGIFPAFFGRRLRDGIEFAPANQKFVDDYNNARRIVDAAASHSSPNQPTPAPTPAASKP
jgi:hypothetical protein